MLNDSRLGFLPRTVILGAIWYASLRLAYIKGRGEPTFVEIIEAPLINNEELITDLIPLQQIVEKKILSASGITQVCSETVWETDRWLVCSEIEGGVGNVRNAVLHCVRYAIEIGASIVLPSLSKDRNMNLLFDVDHFKSSLNEFCPKMAIVDTIESIPNYMQAWFPDPFRPRDLHALATGRPIDETDMLNRHVKTTRSDFDALMGTGVALVCRLAWPTYFEYPISTDSELFSTSFGQILKFQPTVQIFAAEILDKIRLETDYFFGVDMNIDDTDLDNALSTFDIVSALSIKKAEVAELQHLYISGKIEFIGSFTTLAVARGLIVFHRQLLLEPESLKKLLTLTIQQQELVDYIVLLESAHFTGLGDSSFSQNIAISRHQQSSRSKQHLNPAGDEFNSLFGAIDYSFFPDTMWP